MLLHKRRLGFVILALGAPTLLSLTSSAQESLCWKLTQVAQDHRRNFQNTRLNLIKSGKRQRTYDVWSVREQLPGMEKCEIVDDPELAPDRGDSPWVYSCKIELWSSQAAEEKLADLERVISACPAFKSIAPLREKRVNGRAVWWGAAIKIYSSDKTVRLGIPF
jgi:hypothetical protein